jgi:hypothetical protein
MKKKYLLRSSDSVRSKMNIRRMTLGLAGVSFLLVSLYGYAGANWKFAQGIGKTGGLGADTAQT